MAKHTDKEKFESIQDAVVSVIGRHGAGASVALIAKEAGVSTGYLYSHYKSKDEMVNAILEKYLDAISDKIEELLTTSDNTHDIVRGFIEYILDRAKNTPDKLKFIMTLQNDFSYKITDRITERLRNLCNDILQRGRTAGFISSHATAEDLYIILLCLPLQYIGVRFRNFFQPFENNEEVAEKITLLCLNTIRI